MTAIDKENAKNILSAITDYCNLNEGNAITLFGENPDFEGPEYCVGIQEAFEDMELYHGESIVDCLRKGGVMQ